jgi:HTH-type transcriptional regulator, cell division transcriptional repressor
MIFNNIKKERGRRARIIRSMMGFSIKAFAKEIAVSDRTVKSWEQGNAGGLTEKGANKILEVAKKNGLECELTWLMHGIGAQPSSTNPIFNKPILIKEQPGKMVSSKKIIDTGIKNEIDCFHANNANAITLQIPDDGMEPYYATGAIVGGKRRTGAAINELIFQDCIVETKDHQTLCRRLTPGTIVDRFNLSCLNHSTKQTNIATNDVELISAAMVIWYRKII